jgi:predicted nucleic acid-binding protein
MIVVDTNLLVHYWVRSDRTEVAEAILAKDAIWAAPLLWRSEFRNVLVSLVRRGATSLDGALHVVALAESMMSGHEFTVLAHRVLTLATRSRCSAYDCEFVVVAEDLGVPLVTVDLALVRAFPSVAVSPEAFAA